MAKRGPKQIPEAILRLRGSYIRHDQRGGYDLPSAGGEPECPAELGAEEAAEFASIVECLRALSVLSWTDAGAIACMAQAIVELRMLQESVESLGLGGRATQSKAGAWSTHPLVTQRDQCEARVARWYQAFGLTPGARASIKVPTKPEPKAAGKSEFFAKLG